MLVPILVALLSIVLIVVLESLVQVVLLSALIAVLVLMHIKLGHQVVLHVHPEQCQQTQGLRIAPLVQQEPIKVQLVNLSASIARLGNIVQKLLQLVAPHVMLAPILMLRLLLVVLIVTLESIVQVVLRPV